MTCQLRHFYLFLLYISWQVNAHIKALRSICKRKALNAEEGDSLVSKWVNQLLSKALRALDNYLLEVPESSNIDTFLTPPQNRSGKGKREAVVSKSLSKAVTAVFTVGCLVLVCPSVDLKGIIPMLHTIITSGSSKSKPKELANISVSLKQVAPSLYIQSWLTMGKICLADGKLAKRYIPLFVQVWLWTCNSFKRSWFELLWPTCYLLVILRSLKKVIVLHFAIILWWWWQIFVLDTPLQLTGKNLMSQILRILCHKYVFISVYIMNSGNWLNL